MGILHYSEAVCLPDMESSKNPNKKLRLDVNTRSNSPSFGDDLWGQDDLTAEEFDILETQATQSHRAQPTFLHPASVSSKNVNGVNNQIEIESKKQMQYELEGKIKLLTQSVERTKKELNEERLRKEKLLTEKSKEFELQENVLRKEIEKLKSVLQFKDQEVKSISSKVHLLEDQLKEKLDAVPPKRCAEDFSKRFNFETETLPTVGEAKHTFTRKCKLPLDTPLGQMKGSDLVSSLLCNKIPVFQAQRYSEATALSESTFSGNSGLFTISVVKMNLQQEVEELCEHYANILKNHLLYLQSLCAKNSMSNCKTSPLSARHKEVCTQKVSVISCLKDIRSLLLHQSVTPGENNGHVKSKVTLHELAGSNENVSGTSFPSAEQRIEPSNALSLLLKLLVHLTNAETYPNGYNKTEEIELSLCSILTCTHYIPQKVLDHMGEFPISSLLDVKNSISCICITLNIMINLLNSLLKCRSTEKLLEFLTHKASGCLICTISTSLLRIVSSSLEKCTFPLSLAINFLSSIFSSSNFSELKMESSQCVNEVIQFIIPSLCQCLYNSEKKKLNIKTILKKGILFIYFMSNLIPNFKEKRASVEESYVSLICGTLTLSKEDLEYKELYDVIHSLWDFQEEMNEFDLEESNDDSSPMESEAPHIDEL